MSVSEVLSSGRIAPVESCITLCWIQGEGVRTSKYLSPVLFSFLSLFLNPAYFLAHVSLHPLVCGSTDQAAHYHVLNC